MIGNFYKGLMYVASGEEYTEEALNSYLYFF